MTTGRPILVVTTSVVSALFTWFFCGLCGHWDHLGAEFYDVRFVEVLQLAVSGVVAVFVATFVAQRVGANSKRRDLADELLRRIETAAESIIEDIGEYVEAPVPERFRRVKNEFKRMAMLIGAYDKLCADQKVTNGEDNLESLKQSYYEYKRAGTDSPFGEPSPVFHQGQMIPIEDAHYQLLAHVVICRKALYT